MTDLPDEPRGRDSAVSLRLQGDDFYRRAKFEDAVQSYRRCLELDPSDADAFNNLGAALADLRQLEEAITCYQTALLLRPEFGDAQYNLGNAFAELRRYDEADACYREALRLKPAFGSGFINRGNLCRRRGQLADAADCYREAIKLEPSSHLAWNNLGLTLADSGQFQDALAHYTEALRLVPDYPEAHRNQSLTLLLIGEWKRGWAEYEWRWRCPDLVPPPIPKPLWDGSPLAGRRILLYAEQGFGDVIQFVRFAPYVRASGGVVTLAVAERMHRLLSCCPGLDRLVSRDRIPLDFDVHCPLLSLPRIFGISPANVPAVIPYLRVEAPRVLRWKRKLDSVPGFKIGIAWQGSTGYPNDRVRSIPLQFFARLAGVSGVQLVSLQKGFGTEQAQALEEPFPLIQLGGGLDEVDAFVDTAAVISQLDLVITCDSAIAHLAGALGLEAWVPLAFVPDWRWLLGRDDTPWYPTIRFFRQERLDDWDTPFARIADALRARVAAVPKTAIVTAPIAPGELIDKITILEIKSARIADPDKLRNVRSELADLAAVRDQTLAASERLDALASDLRAVNEKLWDIEDEIRLLERDADFGARFIEVARSVYHENDQRAAIKRTINALLGWDRQEEKQHPAYGEEPK
jgi:Flp pilus assembly protein TadD